MNIILHLDETEQYTFRTQHYEWQQSVRTDDKMIIHLHPDQMRSLVLRYLGRHGIDSLFRILAEVE